MRYIIISLCCLIFKMKFVVMEFGILDNKKKNVFNGVYFFDEVIF